MLCLQETKKEQVDKALCRALWGDLDITWAMQPANNNARGILCIWSEQVFRLEKKCSGCGFIYLEGTWIANGVKVNIVNIYLPCEVGLKRNLWDQIRQLRNANLGGFRFMVYIRYLPNLIMSNYCAIETS